MSTPFNTTATAPAALVVPATAAQLKFVATLLAERDWRGQAPKFVGRAAVINVVLDVLTTTDPEITEGFARLLEVAEVATADNLGVRVNQVLAHSAQTAETPEQAAAWAPLTKAGASKMIEWLTGLPKAATAEAPKAKAAASDLPSAEVVPAGRYAIDTNDGAVNEVAFYKVDRPETGKWAGYVFVKLLVSDSEQRMSFAASKAVLNRIAEVGAEAASARYGHEIGRCGICDRTLTNDESRARGIGPVCAANTGW
ncbi:hypothetical protein ARES_46 [Mycobacterium phage Ares]|uniref:Uncharacterized protein n=1 Tax=Mycobacterium phage Ares TaxID=1089112 RepID=G8I7H4_9CAUD|nr:hypothetical protein ARES_46 [Mycobacterium phage Ares]